jgi:hypothetical protein
MLKENNSDYEVINTGVGNYNNVMETEFFKKEGIKMDPDVVFLMYFVNDAEPTPAIYSPLKYIIIKHSYFIAFLSDLYIRIRPMFSKGSNWQEYFTNLYSKDSKALRASSKALENLADVCSEKNIKLVFVSIPDLHVLKNYPFQIATDHVKEVADKKEIPFIDLLPALENEEPSSLWVTTEDQHGNSKMNMFVAKELYKKVTAIYP